MKLGNASKLTLAQVRFIRRATALRRRISIKALAHKFGVSETAIFTASKEDLYPVRERAMRDIRGRA